MYPEDEKRLTPRQPFDLVVRLERNRFFTGEKAPVYEIGQVLDISLLGMGIRTDSPLQPKERVRVYMPVQAVDLPLPVFSEVRWVKAQNNYNQAGLQFQQGEIWPF
jgi:hypothetical protein